MGLRVQLLGIFQFWRNGILVAPSEWRTRRTLDLFKLFVSDPGHRYSIDELIELFWPDMDPKKAVLNLRNRISELREVLEPDLQDRRKSAYVHNHQGCYYFNPDADLYLDIRQFLTNIKHAQQTEKLGKFKEAAREYEKALQLYHGDFLEEDRYEEWTLPCRERYRQHFEKAMFHLAECHARLGQLDEAVQRCTELINYLPCNEEAYRQLMLYYCVSGNHGKAMQTFQKCEKALAEIGTRPSFLTEEIKAKITDAETPSKQQVNLPFLTTILPYLAGPKAVLHQKELRRALEYILYLVEKDVAASRAEEGVSLAELGLNIIIKLEETEGMASCQKQRFMLLSHQASAYDDLGKREEQKACIEQLINIAQETQTPELLAEAYIKQAKYFLAIGSFREAMESAQKCLELSRQLKDQNKEALALNHIGVAYHRLGNCLEAIRHHEEALKIREQINDKKGVASSLNNLGIIFQDSGQYDKALEYYQKSISVCSELNDHFGMGNAHLNSSVACNRLGDYVKALEHLRQAKSHYEEINDEEGVAFVLSNQGSVYVNVGHYSEALVCFEQALAIRERLQARREQALTLNNMSMAYLDLGNTEEALRRFKTAHTIASEIGDQILEAITLANIALCHAGRRNHKKSLGSFNRGLKIVKEIGNKRLEAMMLADKAAVQAEIGQYNHAKKNIQRALRMLESIESLPAGQKASVFFNHFKVLSEMQEEHDAIQSLRKAYEALIEQAEVIRNTAFRESFLTRIPKNREIVKAWEDFRHEA